MIAVLVGGGGGVYVANSFVEDPEPIVASIAPASTTVVTAALVVDPAPERSIDPYRGYGTWVDVFDFDPAYNPPTVAAGDLTEMKDLGDRRFQPVPADQRAGGPAPVAAAAMRGQVAIDQALDLGPPAR